MSGMGRTQTGRARSMALRVRFGIPPAVGAMGLVAAAGSASAQCLQQWDGDFGIPAGLSGAVYALTNWDPDGSGPTGAQLVAAGAIGTAGSVAVNRIARWD